MAGPTSPAQQMTGETREEADARLPVAVGSGGKVTGCAGCLKSWIISVSVAIIPVTVFVQTLPAGISAHCRQPGSHPSSFLQKVLKSVLRLKVF